MHNGGKDKFVRPDEEVMTQVVQQEALTKVAYRERDIQQGGALGDGESGGSGDEEEGRMEMIMARRGILQGKEDNLVKDLKETTLSFKKLGRRYGVSRQAVHAFSKRQGIKRPVKPKGHQIGECRLCQKLIQISKKPHSEFISFHTIRKEMGVKSGQKYRSHLRTLRDRGLVSQRFGRLRSKRAERAYAIYFTKRLPITTIGQKVGITNFQSVMRKHREMGYDVPPPLYVYDGRERSRIRSEIQRRKKR